MSFSKCLISPFLLIFVLFLQTEFVVPTHDCLSSKNFTSNDPYETNLKDLMSYLNSETSPLGFALGSSRLPLAW